MRIKITKGGIFNSKGQEIPVGTELEVKKEPTAWAGRYETISGSGKGKTAVTNPKEGEGGLTAVHAGFGKFNVVDGDKVLIAGMSKADADAFNGMSEEDKAEYVKASKGE